MLLHELPQYRSCTHQMHFTVLISVEFRASSPSRVSHSRIDLHWQDWLWPRMWHINQRNVAFEICPFVFGQWVCRLTGNHRGDILISDSPKLIQSQIELNVWVTVQEYRPASEPTKKPILVNDTRRPASRKIRKTMGHYPWVIRTQHC